MATDLDLFYAKFNDFLRFDYAKKPTIGFVLIAIFFLKDDES
jgi:hypothetical protein